MPKTRAAWAVRCASAGAAFFALACAQAVPFEEGAGQDELPPASAEGGSAAIPDGGSRSAAASSRAASECPIDASRADGASLDGGADTPSDASHETAATALVADAHAEAKDAAKDGGPDVAIDASLLECPHGDATAIARLYDDKTGRHMFSTNPSEGSRFGYVLENATAFYLAPNPARGASLILRCYIRDTDTHYIAPDCSIAESVQEGVLGFAIDHLGACGTVTAYTMKARDYDDMLTTIDASEHERLERSGWTDVFKLGVWTSPEIGQDDPEPERN